MEYRNQKTSLRFGLILIAVSLLTFSVLAYEIVLTRIFSVMLTYHYVFAIVSFALLGLGLGAMMLKKWRRSVPQFNYVIHACALALTLAGSTIAIIKLPVFNNPDFVNIRIWIYVTLMTIPFFLAGLTFAEIFQKFPHRSSLIYGFDLIGATLGAVMAVFFLNRTGAIDAALGIAVIASAGAFLLALSESKGRLAKMSVSVVVIILNVVLLSGGFFSEVPIALDVNKDMLRLMRNPQYEAEIVETRWSAFGRTDLVFSPTMPDEMSIFIDGAAGTTMYNLDSLQSDPHRRMQFLHHFPQSFPFYFLEDGEKDSALIIGAGGGRDVVVALMGNVNSITAVEVNPDLVAIMKKYEDFNGGLYSGLPNVRVVVQEGRNYLRSAAEKYDLIMLALPITKSSRSVEGYALTENYLFTVEAFQDYLDHLTPEGRLVIVAHDESEIYRLLTLALTALENRGIGAPQAMNHIYTMMSGAMPSIVLKRQPLDSLAAGKRHELMHKLGYNRGNFFVPFVPQVNVRPLEKFGIMNEWKMFDQVLVDISTGKLTVDQLVDMAPVDIRPVTDDSPFFYKLQPGLPQPFGLFSLIIILFVAILLVPLVVRPVNLFRKGSILKTFYVFPRLKIFLIIFVLLGIGFMLIEISLLQKLTLIFGQPVLVLSVLLASLLLGTRLGSFCSALINKHLNRMVAIGVLLIAGGVSAYQSLLLILYNLPGNSQFIAILSVVLLGFLLGFPFPLSIRLMKQFDLQDYIPWMYGINGISSVVGSAAAMIIGILWGFSYALYLGAILYALISLAAILLPRFTDRQRLSYGIVVSPDQHLSQLFPSLPGTALSTELFGKQLKNSHDDVENEGEMK